MNYGFFKKADLPVPIFFGIPSIAFHVKVTTIREKRDFIQETVLYLNKNGVQKDEIHNILCLDKNLVNLIIDNSLKSDNVNSLIPIENEKMTQDFYIFFNLLTEEFINGYIDSYRFHSLLSDIVPGSINSSNILYQRRNIGDSISLKIHCLGNISKCFINNTIPSQRDILACYKSSINAFDITQYQSPEFLHEVYPIFLTTAYSVTKYNSNHYSAINPLAINERSIEYSLYFFNLIKQFVTSVEAKKDISEYEENTKNELIKIQNQMMSIKNGRQKKAFELLQSKYRKYSFFEGNIQRQMVMFETEYQFILQNDGTKNVSSNHRVFFDCINNTLEELFKLTYDPYILELPPKLMRENFFENINNAKTLGAAKAQLNRFYRNISEDDSFEIMKQKSDPYLIAKIIKAQNIRSNKVFQLGICDLFTLNVICYNYFSDSGFGRIFKSSIEFLQETLLSIIETRNSIRHTLSVLENNEIQAIHDNTLRIINVCMNVEDTDSSQEIPIVEIDNNFDNYIGEFKGLDDLPESLQTTCTALLRDVYNRNTLYFSDCVIAFEALSTIIIDYSMRTISSNDQLEKYLQIIPDNDDDALLLLYDMLPFEDPDKAQVFDSVGNIKLNVLKAKKSLSRNYKNLSGSTPILFAPLFLAVVDYFSFVNLFDALGRQYFMDVAWAISNRKHSEQTVEWESSKIINDNYMNYCKVISQFNMGEL